MSKWFKLYGFADVHDKLLVGAYPLDRDDVGMLEWMKIERVLNLVEDEEYEPGERRAVEQALFAAGIEEHRLSLTDYGRLPAPELEQAVGEVVAWLEQGRRVYLHCRAGWQRSAAIAAGVVALREGVEIEDALARVHRRKPSADPLPQQREDLLKWWAERGGRAGGTGGADTGAASTAGESRQDETDAILKWLADHDPAQHEGEAAGGVSGEVSGGAAEGSEAEGEAAGDSEAEDGASGDSEAEGDSEGDSEAEDEAEGDYEAEDEAAEAEAGTDDRVEGDAPTRADAER